MVKLKYQGSGKEYITMIPMRDLTDYDLETIMAQSVITERELIDMLCSKGLYKPTNEFACNVCDHVAKSGKAAIRHELKHIEEAELAREENDNGNSTDRTKEANSDR